MVSVCGLLLVTSLCVMVSVLRRCRRRKDRREQVGETSSRPRGVQLDDVIKLLCYTGRRRHRRAAAKPPAGPGTSVSGGQQVIVKSNQIKSNLFPNAKTVHTANM